MTIVSKAATHLYRSNWERIFGGKECPDPKPAENPGSDTTENAAALFSDSGPSELVDMYEDTRSDIGVKFVVPKAVQSGITQTTSSQRK